MNNSNKDTESLQPETVKAAWQAKGFDFGIKQDPPGKVWKDFVHDVDELFMLIEGEVSVTIDGKTINATIGEEVFIPAGSVHSVITSKNGSSRWYYGYNKKAANR